MPLFRSSAWKIPRSAHVVTFLARVLFQLSLAHHITAPAAYGRFARPSCMEFVDINMPRYRHFYSEDFEESTWRLVVAQEILAAIYFSD